MNEARPRSGVYIRMTVPRKFVVILRRSYHGRTFKVTTNLPAFLTLRRSYDPRIFNVTTKLRARMF